MSDQLTPAIDAYLMLTTAQKAKLFLRHKKAATVKTVKNGNAKYKSRTVLGG